jgi:hypothetical protein
MRHQTIREYFVEIGQELFMLCPPDWRSARVDVERLPSMKVQVVCTKEDGSTEAVEPVFLPELFEELAHVVSTEGKAPYRSCVFLLDREANFDVQYTY